MATLLGTGPRGVFRRKPIEAIHPTRRAVLRGVRRGMIPKAGSAYTYGYAVLGEGVG